MQADAVALADALPGEHVGEPISGPVELGERGLAPEEDQCRPVRLPLGRAAQELIDRHVGQLDLGWHTGLVVGDPGTVGADRGGGSIERGHRSGSSHLLIRDTHRGP